MFGTLFGCNYLYLPSNVTVAPPASNFWGIDVILSYNKIVLPNQYHVHDNDVNFATRSPPTQAVSAVFDSGVYL